MPFVTGYISKAERISDRFQVDMDTSRSDWEEVHMKSTGYMSDRISCFKSHKQYEDIVKVAAMAQLEDTPVRIEYEINGEYLNFANQKSSDPATITIVTDKADVPVVTKSAPQRTETPKNEASLSRDELIVRQVAFKGAVDTMTAIFSATSDIPKLDGEDGVLEIVSRMTEGFNDIIMQRYQSVTEMSQSEPDPVEDLGDDDDTQAVMEV